MDDCFISAWERIDRFWGGALLLRTNALSDVHAQSPRTVQEVREHFSTMARIKGRSWYAKKLLAFQHFPSQRVACETLIRLSRERIAQTRGRIARTKNILAFSSGCRRSIN